MINVVLGATLFSDMKKLKSKMIKVILDATFAFNKH